MLGHTLMRCLVAGIVGALDQHHPTATFLAIARVPQQVLHRVVDRDLIGAWRGVLNTELEIRSFILIMSDEGDEFSPVRQRGERGRSRQTEDRIELIWLETAEGDQERRQSEFSHQGCRGRTEYPSRYERDTGEQESKGKREGIEKGHCFAPL